MAPVQRYGPYGNDKAEENYSFQINDDETITEVIVWSGFMVDAIGFTITGDDGDSRTNIYGGNGGSKNKIDLQLGENILGISGRSKGSKISQLRIHTDLVPRGHGPYGDDELKDGSDFQSPMPLLDNQELIGFFGSAQDSVASIGLYVQME